MSTFLLHSTLNFKVVFIAILFVESYIITNSNSSRPSHYQFQTRDLQALCAAVVEMRDLAVREMFPREQGEGN